MAIGRRVGNIPRLNYFGEGEDVAVVAHTVVHPTQLHVHEFFEIVYVEEGRLIHRYGPTSHLVGAGELFIVNPHIPHGYDLTSAGSAQIWNLLLTERALNFVAASVEAPLMVQEIAGYERGTLDYRRLQLPSPIRERIGQTIKDMYAEYREKQEGYQAILRGQLLIVVGLINRALVTRGVSVATQPGPASGLGPLIRYIVEHCGEPLSVAELAGRSGWTADHLNRLFKRMTGDTTQEYITRVRMAKAARALLTEEQTVEGVAKEVGYGDARAFRRAFKRYYGMTPSAFRRRS